MLQFIGVASFGAPLPLAAAMEQAARRLGGPDFQPARSWRGPGCVFAWRLLPLRAESGTAPVPVQTADGALTLIGSGRIDQRQDLIASLGLPARGAIDLPPHGSSDLPARGWSDTGLMLESVSRWGETGAGRLMGHFGFAVWDHTARRLTLARDNTGSVPIMYHRGDGFVAFGTNPAAILALGLCSREIDGATLGEHLIRRSADLEASFYKDLRRVRHGATHAFDPSGSRQTIYWQPKRGPVLRLKDDEAYVEATRDVLAEVHRGHARATDPIGVMLSGGFDSGAVAATLAMLMPEREIFGFTTVPVAGDPAYGRGQGREWAHVQALARMHPNLRVEAIAEKKVKPLDTAFRDFFADTGLPLTGIAFMTRQLALVEAARARGVRTLLSGGYGNLTLTSEGPQIFAELFRSGRWLAFAREVLGTARFLGAPARDVLWSEALRDIVPRSMLRAWRNIRGVVPIPVTENNFLRTGFAGTSGLLARWRACPRDPGKRDLHYRADMDLLILDYQPSHMDGIALMNARMGLEVLSPLQDRRMTDFILSLPATQLRRNGVIRFLARRVLADRLPAETLGERGYFESFADEGQWLATWWDEAARRLEDQHPADLAAAAIDLPALRACLAKGPPENLPPYGPQRDLLAAALPGAVHINQFLRWHQGMND